MFLIFVGLKINREYLSDDYHFLSGNLLEIIVLHTIGSYGRTKNGDSIKSDWILLLLNFESNRLPPPFQLSWGQTHLWGAHFIRAFSGKNVAAIITY